MPVVTARDNILAIIYDWHNAAKLKDQNSDICFWRRIAQPLSSVALMGAGTGRLAVPLAQNGSWVMAVDKDAVRLARITPLNNLARVCADFTQISFARNFDNVIFPYSALQLVPPGVQLEKALTSAADLAGHSGFIWIDVSDNFAKKRDFDRQTIHEGYCEELDMTIREEQSGQIFYDHFALSSHFILSGGRQLNVLERWYFHPEDSLVSHLTQTGLAIKQVFRGYGNDKSIHRRIYRIRMI